MDLLIGLILLGVAIAIGITLAPLIVPASILGIIAVVMLVAGKPILKFCGESFGLLIGWVIRLVNAIIGWFQRRGKFSQIFIVCVILLGVASPFAYPQLSTVLFPEKLPPLSSFTPKNGKYVMTPTERRISLDLPIPFETVLRSAFPDRTTQQSSKIYGGDFGGTVGWDMDVSALPTLMPSRKEFRNQFGIDDILVVLNDQMKLACINTKKQTQRVLEGCRQLSKAKDGIWYQEFEADWAGEVFPVGTKVQMYMMSNCTRELIDADEPCAI